MALSALPRSLLLFGAGKMGAAMLRGWLKSGLKGGDITIVDPHVSDEIRTIEAEHGCRVNPAPETIAPQQVLVLAIKPQMLDEAAALLKAVVTPETLVISILAGKTIADVTSRVPATKAVIRAMPNTPAAVGRGITGLAASDDVSDAQKATAEALLSSIGVIAWLDDEVMIDAVTAVSGSGPAYVFYMVECLAKAAMAIGFTEAMAMRFARATIEGAGELLHQEKAVDAGTLRTDVTSPGGTTAAALGVLMAEDGLEPLMRRAVEAAKRRAGELSG